MTDQFGRHENAGTDNTGRENARPTGKLKGVKLTEPKRN